MRHVQPTAQEQFEYWKEGDKYLEDPDSGASNPQEVFADANRTIQLAELEGIPLEQLVPDAETRKRLEDHAAEFDKIVDEGPDYDDPPDETELRMGDVDWPEDDTDPPEETSRDKSEWDDGWVDWLDEQRASSD